VTDPSSPTGCPDPLDEPVLHDVLARAQRLGFIGPAPVISHLIHSQAFLPLVGPRDRVADLGSGAGLPGLVIAVARPEATVCLVEVAEGRADHLRRAILALGLEARVTVDQRPAEQVGRDPDLRGTFDVVTARGFGPPGVVAECAAPLLHAGGHLVVSEPPGSDGSRWAGVKETDLPFGAAGVQDPGQAAVASLRLETACPDRYPRAVGVPARRPLF
jgi:16S rRNA (guanine527-N7)-methyltransferase